MTGPAAKADDPLLGTTVAGRFEVRERLARGGMGWIYHAVQVGLGRDVALKVMHAGEDEEAAAEFAKRMLNEAAAAAKLGHPNTIVIHDYGHCDDGRCFIAMELLDGGTLHDLIAEEGPLPAKDVVHIALQVAGSLAEAHEAGMIHRDLKPGNVMLTKKGADRRFVKVVDFGLVKNDPKDSAVDESGALVGTPRYMAPEQVVNERVSPATDVYGL
ncbi:MAG: serine/threonine protein kinase, partial [Myxococcales bacterium]|nr:serine/threonine protein kinase [Myxococcales bacterium]